MDSAGGGCVNQKYSSDNRMPECMLEADKQVVRIGAVLCSDPTERFPHTNKIASLSSPMTTKLKQLTWPKCY